MSFIVVVNFILSIMKTKENDVGGSVAVIRIFEK